MGVLRRFLQVFLLLATLLVGAAAAVIVVSQTAWFKDWLRGLIVRQANQYLDGTLSIGRLGGNLFFGLEFEDLGITQGGERVVAVRNAGIDYSVIQFVSGNVEIDHIRLDKPVVVLRKEAGKWNLAQLVKRQQQEKERTGPGRAVSIGEVGISDGTFIMDPGTAGTSGASGDASAEAGERKAGGSPVPREIRKLNARFSFAYEPVRYTVDIGHVSLRAHHPDIVLNDLSGRISTREADLFLERIAVRTAESSLKVNGQVANYSGKPELRLEASSDKLDLPEIARLVPALRGIPLQPAFEVKASGPLNAAAFDFAVTTSAGNASGQVTADLLGREHGLKGEVHLDALDLAPIVRTPAARSRLSGVARMDVRFPGAATGPVVGSFSVSTFSARVAGYEAEKIEARGRVDGRRVTIARANAVAYGARATASGTVEPGVRGPDGKRGLAMDVHGAVAGLDLRRLPRGLKVPLLDSRLNLEYRVAGVGAEIEAEGTIRPSVLEGAGLGDGTRVKASTIGPTIQYAAEGSIRDLDLQRYGRGLGIAALSADRFASDVAGRFSVRGSGTALATLRLDANAALHTSTLGGISLPLMNVEAHIADGAGRFKADGGFSNLDPSRFTGKPETRGNVAGRVNVDVSLERLSGPMTPDSVSASGEVALDRSTVGGLEIDRARVAGEYANSGGRIDEATITGPDIGLRASGPLALGPNGTSNLAYHFETPDLGAIGKVVGREGMQGFVSLDGRVTGNRASLQAAGELKAGNLRYGGADVLTARSQYSVAVPDLDAARSTVKAESTFGFVKVGGQEINVLRANTTYENKQVAFDVTAEQSVRNGRFAGTVLLHPDHQEVHLGRFDFSTQGITWAMAPGTEPTVRYGGNRIAVQDVHLVSGTQSLAVEGTLGKADSNLRAALTNVDLSRLDTWLIGDRRLGGMLNAAATVTGPREALSVSSDFSVDNGSFRDFRYETLGGNVTYAGERLDVDVRLQQGPQSWLTARGTVPTALFRSPETPAGAPAPGSSAPVDLAIKSSPIDLGLVQGFTEAITEAKGTLVADVRVAGTAARPEMSGQVQVSGGAFKVTPSGVSYREMNGGVTLRPGRAVIDQLAVTDEHGERMVLSGEMGVQGRSLGALQLKVQSRKFEVIHNDLGRVTLNSALDVRGQLRAPQIAGEVAINTATINLDRVFDLLGSSAYSTRPESVTGMPGPGERPGAPPVGVAGRGQTNPAGAPQAPPAGRGQAAVGGQPPAGGGAQRAQGAAQEAGGGRGAVAGGRQATAGGAQGEPGAAATGGVFDAAVVNLTLKVPDDLVLTGKDIQPGNTPIGLGNVNIVLGGDLRVSKPRAQPVRLVGQVNTVRGTYDFQGRRFEIQRDGRVRFDGLVPMNPALDIAATRLISGVETRVHVGGTLRKPELTLASKPPLDQADILSLIVFNQPANQLGEGQQVSLAQRASALATGFVAGKLADSLGRALNLDVFEIQTAATPGGQGATVTLGEQVGRNLYFKVVQGVGADNVSQFVLDYNFTDWLRLETTVTQGGTATRSPMRRVEQSGADLIFFFSY